MSNNRGTAATYGDVTGEYVSLRTGAGWVSAGHDAVSVEGPDAESFLQGVISQDVVALRPENVSRSLLLGPQGKLRAQFWVLKGTNEVVLLTDSGRGADLVAELDRYRFRVQSTVALIAGPVFGVIGPAASNVLDRAGWPVPSGWERTPEGWVASIPLGSLPRYAVVGIEPGKLTEAGALRVGSLAADAVRVEAGEPVMGRDIDEKTIPQESGLVPEAVSFDKGCYVGQELVARIDSRGHVNRHLRGIVISANILPPEKAELYVDGASVGRVTSVVESLTLRAPIGLALVRREVEPGAAVEVRWEGGSTRGTVHDLPLSDFTES